MNFFRHHPRELQRWAMERAHPGRHHNSPDVWRYCGQVYAESRREALAIAEHVVGFGNVRVSPVNAEDGQ